MYKKLIIICCIFLLCSCNKVNINTLSLNEIVDDSIKVASAKTNINAKGFKYFLPSGFSLYKDDNYIHELKSKSDTYYLNVDIISYYYKNEITTEHNADDYLYYEFNNGDKKGYLRVIKNNDTFFIELCYNYAIIEVEVEEDNVRYAVSRCIEILKSIEYNDLVIDKYVNTNNIEARETVYKIPEPEKKNIKNVLEYMDDEGESDNNEYNETQEEDDAEIDEDDL